jgi:hypothetical protein
MDRKFVPDSPSYVPCRSFAHPIPMIDNFAEFPDGTPFRWGDQTELLVTEVCTFQQLTVPVPTVPMHLFN